ANELLTGRLTVEDAADAHVMALDRAPVLCFEIFVLSAPTPFARYEAEALKSAAADVIERHFPDAAALYARRGWRLPTSIGRVYDTSRIERVMGFRCATDFGRVLHALRTDGRRPRACLPIAERKSGAVIDLASNTRWRASCLRSCWHEGLLGGREEPIARRERDDRDGGISGMQRWIVDDRRVPRRRLAFKESSAVLGQPEVTARLGVY